MTNRRIITPHGTWIEAETPGQFILKPARRRGGTSGPLEPGYILRSKLIKSVGQLIREIFPVESYHSDRIMKEGVTITFNPEKPKKKPKKITKSFSELLEEENEE